MNISILNNPIVSCDNSLLEEQLLIEHKLISGMHDYEGEILILPIEAGGNKSRQLERSLVYYYLTNHNASSLVVKIFFTEAAETVKRINNATGTEIACVIASDQTLNQTKNKKAFDKLNNKEKYVLYTLNKEDPDYEIKKKHNNNVFISLKEYYVLVITHKRYINLSDSIKLGVKKGREKLISYKDGKRKNLIIDEEIGIFDQILSINHKLLAEICSILPENLKDGFNDFIEPIKNGLNAYYGRTVKREKQLPEITNSIFKQAIMDGRNLCHDIDKKIELGKSIISKVSKNTGIEEAHKLKIIEKLENILSYYYTKGVYVTSTETVYYIKRTIDFWLLDNNIILDANGKINELYKCQRQEKNYFKVIPLKFTRFYKMFTFAFAKTNTTMVSKSAKLKKPQDGMRTRADLIHHNVIKHLINKDENNHKILIITRKEFEQKIKELISDAKLKSEVSVDHFGNLLGKNQWRDYDKCYILDTPLYPFHCYVLKEIGYSGHDMNREREVELKKTKHKFRFTNPNENRLEKIKSSLLLGQFYQAAMRINRDYKKSCIIYIFTDEKEVLDQLIKLFPRASVEEQEFEIQTEGEKKSEDSKEEKRTNVLNLFNNIYYDQSAKSEYNKSEIYDLLGGSRKQYSFIWKDTKVLDYCSSMKIVIKNHKVCFTHKQWGKTMVIGKDRN